LTCVISVQLGFSEVTLHSICNITHNNMVGVSMRAARSWMRRIDVFAYQPEYEYPAFRSILGSIFTIIALVLLVAYAIVEFISFVEGDPAIRQTTLTMSYTAVPIPPTYAVIFRDSDSVCILISVTSQFIYLSGSFL